VLHHERIARHHRAGHHQIVAGDDGLPARPGPQRGFYCHEFFSKQDLRMKPSERMLMIRIIASAPVCGNRGVLLFAGKGYIAKVLRQRHNKPTGQLCINASFSVRPIIFLFDFLNSL
jgi:hypothetical protein